MEDILKYYQDLHDSLGRENLCESFSRRIIQIMQAAFDQIPDEASIGIRGGGVHTVELLKAIRIMGKNIVGIFDKEVVFDEFCGYPLFPASDLSAKAPDYIVISNYFYRDEIKKELADCPAPVIDLYDELEKNGIKIQGPFYMFTSDSPLVLSCYYWKYREYPSQRTLEQLLQAALEQKNFVMISKVYEEAGGINGKYPLLIDIWDKTIGLLRLIREKIQQRKQRDIILLWTDAVPYSDLGSLPETKRRAETESCFFLNTYTHTPFTYATLQAMFCETLPIDDYPAITHDIDLENSPLLQYLEDQGYELHCFGAPAMHMTKNFTEEQKYVSSTIVWWHALQNLLCQKKPGFYILQFLMGCHPPTLYPMQRCVDKDAAFYRKTKKQADQKKEAMSFLDQCLSLFDWMLGDKIQIQLSDHGFFYSNEAFWHESMLHAYCFVKGKDIPVLTVSELFPYKRFFYLVRWIIDPYHNKLDAVKDDMVLFQDIDHYDRHGVVTYIQEKNARHGLAYRGVLTKQYKYAINALGEEFFYVFKDGQYVQETLTNDVLRKELQEKCGTYFLDIREIEQFKYSLELYRAIQKAEPECNQPLWLNGGAERLIEEEV